MKRTTTHFLFLLLTASIWAQPLAQKKDIESNGTLSIALSLNVKTFNLREAILDYLKVSRAGTTPHLVSASTPVNLVAGCGKVLVIGANNPNWNMRGSIKTYSNRCFQ